MMTYDETYDLAQNLNEEAHNLAWDTWIAAEELEHEGEDEEAEEKRDEASQEQAEHFRDLYYGLAEDQQEAISHWLRSNKDFRDEFAVWFGENEFYDEFDQSEQE